MARRQHQGQPAVVLDRTAFYGESGGQPWDTGTLEGVPVVAVIEDGDDVVHVLERPLEHERVRGRVDGERRRDHRQQHHGQHLLSRALLDLLRARTMSFHLGAESSTIDLDREVDPQALRPAEARANEIVWQARPVAVRTVTRAEALALGADPPAEAGEAVRLVEAQGFDLQPCGGTHPRSTAEVGFVLILGSERHKGGCRIRFVCGHRALDAFRARSAAVDRLAQLLSSPLEALPEAAARTLEQLAEATRRSRDLLERVLEAEAHRLLSTAGSPPVVVTTYQGWPPEDLRTLATHLVRLAPCVALLGCRADKAHLVFAQSDGLGHDIPGLLRTAAEVVGGRGGGKANMAQGGGDRVDRLDEALAGAAASVRGSSGR